MLGGSSGVRNETQGQVLLVDIRESRLTFGTAFDERANKVRAHPVDVTQERTVNDGYTFMNDAFLMILKERNMRCANPSKKERATSPQVCAKSAH